MNAMHAAIESLAKASGALPDGELASLRRHGLAIVNETGLPTTRDEDWKYTDLAAASEIQAQWAAAGAPAGEPDKALVEEQLSAYDAAWIVFANGSLLPDLSPGLACKGLQTSTIESFDGTPDTALTGLNAALLQSALSITIDDTFDSTRPIGLLFADSAPGEPMVSSVRVDIRLERGSKAQFLEHHVSRGAGAHFASNVVRLVLAEGAQCDYVRLQERATTHVQLAQLDAGLESNSVFRHLGIDLGGELTRNDLAVDIAGRGADASFDGVYVVADGQHTDNHTRADHRVGPARSAQEYRGVASGHSRAVWNGKAVVHKGADGTDAKQANHNLLLSEKAEIDAKPELEIYADDVKCAHGTTVGQLDERALFYLRARGISHARARRILTRAFAAAVIEKCPIASLAELLGDKVERRLREIAQRESA